MFCYDRARILKRFFFYDRVDAGRLLAQELTQRQDLELPQDTVVLGLPRGGVPVAAEVARAFNAELDVLVVRKLGVPFRPELAMGAVGEDEITVLNPEIIRRAGVTKAEQADAIRQQRQEVRDRVKRLRPHRTEPVQLQDRTAVIVDDGVATGATAKVGGQLARARGAARVILAIPVAPYTVIESLTHSMVFDDIVCLYSPARFKSVGAYFADFEQVSDAQVRQILEG